MYAFLWVLLATAVPNVTAGPELAEEAILVEAPIAHVTVFSDRARVRRRATQALKAGTQVFRLSDLPGKVMMDTVRVACRGGKVLRIETIPIERERITIDQVDELVAKLETMTDKLALADAVAHVHGLELGFLNSVLPAAPVPEHERVGKPMPPVKPELWGQVLDFLQQRKERARAELRKQAVARRKLVEELEKIQREVSRHDLGAFSDRRVQVVAIVHAKAAAQARLELEYFVPGAAWWPSYDLDYDSQRSQVSLRTAGLVQQATGEDWADVELELSTAIPGQGMDLPELLTWALGEKKEFVPVARAARMPAEAPRFPPPSAQPTAYEAERQAKLQVLRQRIAELQGLISTDGRIRRTSTILSALADSSTARDQTGVAYDIGDMGLESRSRGSGARRDTATKKYKPRPHRASPPPPPAPSMAPMAKSRSQPVMDFEHDEVAMAAEEAMPSGGELLDGIRASSSTERTRTTSLGLFEPGYYSRPHFSDSNLPAVVAGGLDYVYACPTRVSIPSSAERMSVPLSVDVYPAETFYEATPSLKKTAYLKAEVQNKGARPILGGPVNIFMGGDFAGQGRLNTTGPGGKLSLPLGADEDIRLKRTVVPKTDQEGVFSKDDVTEYLTTIEVGNYKRRAIKVSIIDQVPLSGNEKIEIESLKFSPAPEARPDGKKDPDGIQRWSLELPAGSTKKIEFKYKITRPANWQLRQ